MHGSGTKLGWVLGLSLCFEIQIGLKHWLYRTSHAGLSMVVHTYYRALKYVAISTLAVIRQLHCAVILPLKLSNHNTGSFEMTNRE